MPRYATETTVPIERSKAEIEAMVSRYGATEYVSGWRATDHYIGFRLRELLIRFVLPIPPKNDKRFTHRVVRKQNVRATEQQSERAWEQECRSRWRALNLVVRAKLEAVECGISTLEKEFMAFIVVPGTDSTIGDFVVDRMLPDIRAGRNPLALKAHEPIQDAELEGEVGE